jgi:hypothetical protein
MKTYFFQLIYLFLGYLTLQSIIYDFTADELLVVTEKNHHKP